MSSRSQISELPDGSLVTGDGRMFHRTPVRLKRRDVGDFIDEGSPVVTSVYPEGLTLYLGPDAAQAWQAIKPRLIEGKRPPVSDLQWTGRLWRSDDGGALLFFTGEH